MSAAGGLAATLDGPLRYLLHLQLERELSALAAVGQTTVRFEPAGEALAAMGANLVDDDRSPSAARAASAETAAYLAREEVAARLGPLTGSAPSRLVA